MTDLHCHLLPGMDDGAKDEQAAVDLICTSYKQGVRRIALTSHFLPDEMALDEFLSRRQAAYSRLLKALRQTEIPIGEIAFRLGAEVLYSPMLVELPSNLLCLEGTNLMLLEFREGEVPFGVEETVFRLQLRGIVPLLAHVERYRYADLLHTDRGDLWQTSSRITGQLPEDYRSHIGDILFSQLPAGSITGAPKPKTMEIIHQAEPFDRGFYTGVMGLYRDGNLDSAVMIRFIDKENGQLYFKAGGGITARSDWNKEYEEVIEKIYVPIHRDDKN